MNERELRDLIVAVLAEHGRQATPVAESDNVLCVQTSDDEMFFVEVTPA